MCVSMILIFDLGIVCFYFYCVQIHEKLEGYNHIFGINISLLFSTYTFVSLKKCQNGVVCNICKQTDKLWML